MFGLYTGGVNNSLVLSTVQKANYEVLKFKC